MKLKPPTYDGNYATFEEWKYKFKAYMGIQDNIYPDLLSRAERATTVLTDAELTAAEGTPEEAERWIQPANNLKYILISTTTAAAATVCGQHQQQPVLKYTGNFANALQPPWEEEAWATSQNC